MSDMNARECHELSGIARLGVALCLALGVVLCGCATRRGFPPVFGIANFDRVTARVYRGAQPNQVGYQALAALGVVKVINLRADALPAEADWAREAGIEYVAAPLAGFGAPTGDQVDEILREIQRSPGPVFVHCQFGCDRTGTIVACYRVRAQGWSGARALAEARGYGMSPLEVGMARFVRRFR